MILEVQNNIVTMIDNDVELPSEILKIKEAFRVNIPNAKYSYLYKSRKWDGKANLITDHDGKGELPAGLLNKLLAHVPDATVKDIRMLEPIELESTTVKLRSYQKKAVNDALTNTHPKLGWYPRGILRVATGGGKTEMAVAMTEMANVPTTFLVHTKDLLFQAKKRFEKYGHTVGLIGSGEFEPDNDIIIATMQTVNSIMKRGTQYMIKNKGIHVPSEEELEKASIMAEVLDKTEQVFFDEAHIMAADAERGNMFIKIANMLPNAYLRWGLTATPFMRDDYSNLLLQGVTGDLLCDISNDLLIKAGHLSVPTIKINKTGFTKLSKKEKDWKVVYDIGIVTNKERNAKIVEAANAAKGPTLILTTFVTHADILAMMGKFPVVAGRTPIHERQKIVHKLKRGEIKTVIANKVWDEGVDIPELDTVILAAGGKSQVKALQRIGRSLRKADGKNTATIIDFADRHHLFLKRHGDLRKKYWEQEKFKIEEYE